MRYNTSVIEPAGDLNRTATRESVLGTLRDLPISSLSADRAHLYLGVPDLLVDEGIRLMKTWGFAFESILLWAKHQAAPGEFFSNAHEIILFGVKGGLPPLKKDVRTWFLADGGVSGALPEDFYRLVEQVSPGPRIHFFRQDVRAGWESSGKAGRECGKGIKNPGCQNTGALAVAATRDGDWLTCDALSRRISVSIPTIRRWTQQGIIPSRRLGRLVRYDRSEVEKAISNGLPCNAQGGARVRA